MQLNSSGFVFICLYRSYPSYHGASDITFNLFNLWPNKNKKLLQISEINKKKKNIINIKKKNSFFGFIVNLIIIVQIANKYLSKFNNKFIIIEGASWAGYTLLILFINKFFLQKIKIIYHAHNLEYEVRKYKNNILIAWITFYFEKIIYKYCYGTCVSKKDQRFIKKKYNANSVILDNGVTEIKSKKLMKVNLKKNNFLLFCGSYSYWPNKIAINKIYNQRNLINKIFPKIKFVFTGENIPNFSNKKFVNLKIVKKTNLIWLIKNCLFFYAPMPRAPGTKMKILESVYYGATTVCSKNALVGITKTKNINSIIITKDKKLSKDLLKLKNKIKIKKNYSEELFKFKNFYNFEKKTLNFYDKIKNI